MITHINVRHSFCYYEFALNSDQVQGIAKELQILYLQKNTCGRSLPPFYDSNQLRFDYLGQIRFFGKLKVRLLHQHMFVLPNSSKLIATS